MSREERIQNSVKALKHLSIIVVFTTLYRENIWEVLERSGDGNAFENFLNAYQLEPKLYAGSLTVAVAGVLTYSTIRLRRSVKNLLGHSPKLQKRPLPNLWDADYKGPFYWCYPDKDFSLSDEGEPDINLTSNEGQKIQESKKNETE